MGNGSLDLCMFFKTVTRVAEPQPPRTGVFGNRDNERSVRKDQLFLAFSFQARRQGGSHSANEST